MVVPQYGTTIPLLVDTSITKPRSPHRFQHAGKTLPSQKESTCFLCLSLFFRTFVTEDYTRILIGDHVFTQEKEQQKATEIPTYSYNILSLN
jgi:hypothetical protein